MYICAILDSRVEQSRFCRVSAWLITFNYFLHCTFMNCQHWPLNLFEPPSLLKLISDLFLLVQDGFEINFKTSIVCHKWCLMGSLMGASMLPRNVLWVLNPIADALTPIWAVKSQEFPRVNVIIYYIIYNVLYFLREALSTSLNCCLCPSGNLLPWCSSRVECLFQQFHIRYVNNMDYLSDQQNVVGFHFLGSCLGVWRILCRQHWSDISPGGHWCPVIIELC